MFDHMLAVIRRKQFTRAKQRAFLEDLVMLVEDGVPVTQAVKTMAQVSDDITEQVASRILVAIGQGQSLADGMQYWFARPLVEVVRAGEMSGTLPKTLRVAANAVVNYTDLVKQVVGYLVYPLLVFVVALVVIVMVRHSVLDNFAQLRPIAAWPDAGQRLYRLAYITERWWWLSGLLILGLVYLLGQLLSQLTGRWRAYLDMMPGLSLYARLQSAQFMKTLGMLLSSGVVVKRALTIMHHQASPFLSWHILQMELRLSGGRENMADVLDTQLISEHDIIRLRTVATTKGFDYALERLGGQVALRASQQIQKMARVFGAVLLLLAALLAMMMVFGIYSVGGSVAT